LASCSLLDQREERPKVMALMLDQFSRNFGVYSIPNVLKELLDFQNASHAWYSKGFELSIIEQEELREHVTEEKISQFLGFGHDANYSIYALWLYQDVPLEEAPVVYFNSEGEGSTVFAQNLFEFFRLLARDEEPIFGKYSEKEDGEIEHTARNREFRTWLNERYHLQMASRPNEIVRIAQLHHPKLPLIYA
jgi:hypothetical protein